jgi:putative chitinase
MEINQFQLRNIIGNIYDPSKFDKITDSLNKTFAKYQIDSRIRICHFLAQVLHESGCFKYNEEIWGPTPTQRNYEGRKDLGNCFEGDGYKFRGRGYIQLTGRANYKAASAEFGQDLIANPDLVSQFPLVAYTAGWYWKTHVLNSFADADDILSITKKINGGTNGLDDRKKWLEKSKLVLK